MPARILAGADLSLWLAVLKYLGLVLAAGSSVWATLNVLTTTADDGRKHLTPAGVVAICMTVGGLAISLISEDLQRRRTAAASAEQVKAEARRTNAIIIAGQPLTSLEFQWRFTGLPAAVEKVRAEGDAAAMTFIEGEQGERSDEQNSAVFRRKALYPFLGALARNLVGEGPGEGGDKVVAILALDDVPNAVLPFGGLDTPKPERSYWTKETHPPVSIEFATDFDRIAQYGNDALQHWPDLISNQGAAEIRWRIDPGTFGKALNRQNQYVVPTAKLPSVLRLAVLFDIGGLPFSDGNLALPSDQDFWRPTKDPDGQQENFRGEIKPPAGLGMTVRLVPNNSSEIVNEYGLARIYETQFQDGYGEANSDLRCVVFEFHLVGGSS